MVGVKLYPTIWPKFCTCTSPSQRATYSWTALPYRLFAVSNKRYGEIGVTATVVDCVCLAIDIVTILLYLIPFSGDVITSQDVTPYGGKSSRVDILFISNLTEASWTIRNNAYKMASVMHRFKWYILSLRMRTVNEANFELFKGNCSAKLKKRFILGHLAWRTVCGLNDDIFLLFIVADHT